MATHHAEISVETRTGLVDITDRVAGIVRESQIANGVCVVFIRHTSASLVIQENADDSARRDLERWLAKLAPENDPAYTHTAEGPDDMPSHLRAAVTRTSETVPVLAGRLALGTWQGIYVWEHRRRPHRRSVVVTVLGELH